MLKINMLLPTLRGAPSPCISMHNLVHGKSVRQRTVRQDNTMDRAGTGLEAVRDHVKPLYCIEIQHDGTMKNVIWDFSSISILGL